MVRGYQLKLYPSPAQAELINKTIGCSRFIYNYYLNDIIKNKTDTCLSKVKEIPNLCLSFPWLKEVDGGSLRISLFNLENNLKRWKKGIAGFPKIKTKDFGNSYTTNNFMTYKGKEAIRERLEEISNKGYEATNKENSISESLKVALEASCRGIKFAPIDLNKSEALHFIIDEQTNALSPPFRTIDGLGDTVAKTIVEARKEQPFLSKDDLQTRGKVSKTLMDKMDEMGILQGLPESNQLSLF